MRPLLISAALLLLVQLFAMPATPWEFDETLFFRGIHNYDPVAHHPPPPGYPVFMLVGHLVRLIVPGDMAAMLVISVAGTMIAFVMFALAFRNLTGDATAGLAGAILFYFSPAMLVHSTLPIAENGALALLATALYFMSRGDSPALFAVFAALSVGWRIQFAIFIVPLFLIAVLMMKRWRDRAIALGVFTLVCLLWLAPLTMAVGGSVDDLVRFQRQQANYLVAHDADQSRTGWTLPRVALRFVAHPWGTKVMSFPLLLVAAAGFVELARRWQRAAVPLAVAALGYIAFALWVMDPADGVRYAIPFVMSTAFLAGVGAVRWIPRPFIAVGIAAVGGIVYTSSLLSQRSSSPSPPVQAVEYVNATLPRAAVALYELPLWPHATYFFADRNPQRVDRGLAEYYDKPDVPLFIYADGLSTQPGARVFRWKPSDAYSKLTRNHYRVISIIHLPPERRFKALSGIHAPEREVEGEEWRWIASQGELQLPAGPARRVTLRVGLPPTYPFETNDVQVTVVGMTSDSRSHVVHLVRARPANVAIDVPAGAPIIRIEAANSFVPAEIAGSLSFDPRRLSVKLYSLETTSAAAAVAPPVEFRRPAPQTAPPQRRPARRPRAAA